MIFAPMNEARSCFILIIFNVACQKFEHTDLKFEILGFVGALGLLRKK